MLASAPAPVCHIHNESVALCLPAGELREDTAAVCWPALVPSVGFVTEGSLSAATIR